MKIYGTAKLRKDGKWQIKAEPHVMLVLRRVLSRVRQDHGAILMRATEETSRDLLWVSERYPLDFGADRDRLEEMARAYDARALLCAEIASGAYTPPHVEMALAPRAYQANAAAMAVATRGMLLADDLGIGKTVSALATIALAKTMPVVIVCPVHIQRQWQREVWRFLRLESHIAQKSKPYQVRGLYPDILIISYHKLHGWRDVIASAYRFVIFDECQELRRRGTPSKPSKKYEAAEHIAHAAEMRLGLSATPIYNYGGEFWNVVNVLRPDALGTRAEFLREWCLSSDDPDKAMLREPKAFGTYLRDAGIMLRRTRSEVSRELPSLTRIVQEVECDVAALEKIQTSATELARIILDQGGARRGIEKMQAGGELDMKMRQATGIAKAPYVAGFVRMLLESSEDPVVLFGWHRAVYDLWLDLLAEYKPAMYTGSESPAKKQSEIDRFIRGDSRVLLMSLRSGAGVDGLQSACSRVVIGELDWSPGAIEQCIGRVHRDGQASPVFAYYVVTQAGADVAMQDVLGIKSGQIDPVKDPDAPLIDVRQADPDHIKKLAAAVLARPPRAASALSRALEAMA